MQYYIHRENFLDCGIIKQKTNIFEAIATSVPSTINIGGHVRLVPPPPPRIAARALNYNGYIQSQTRKRGMY